MRHSFCRIRSVFFRRSVWMSFFCPCPISGGVVSLTLRKRGHRKIISHSAGHSVVTGIWAAKKAGTSMCADRSQKDSLIPLWCWFHIHVTGFEIQSRNCQLRFLIADSLEQFRSGGISFSHTAALSDLKSSFIIYENPYSVVALLWEHFVIYCRTSVCQYFRGNVLIIFLKLGIIYNFSESQKLNAIHDWHASLEKC